MKKSKNGSSKSNEPSSIIQVGVVFIVVAAIALTAVAFKLYSPF